MGGFFDKIAALFGKAEEPQAAAPGKGERKKMAKQVFEGKPIETPEWAEGLDGAQMISVIEQHFVCKFHPHIEYKKIFTTRKGIDGELETEYEGIACDCGAIKTYGLQIAQGDGYLQAYRYVDLNHIYRCCCGNPKRCPFYFLASEGDEAVNKQMRNMGR